MWWEIDYGRFIALLTPSFLRRKTLTAFLTTPTLPLLNIYVLWRANRDDNMLRLTCTGQVCRLRGLLNDRLDSELRRITISDGTANYFNVRIPYILENSESISMIKVLLNEYKLASKKFKIYNMNNNELN